MPVSIENETHWRTADVKRIILAALEAGGARPEACYSVSVGWTSTPHAQMTAVDSKGSTIVTIGLPRRGPKDPHRNPMMAVAVSALPVDDDAMVLAHSETFRFANLLAWAVRGRQKTVAGADQTKLYEAARTPDMPPSWAPVETFTVQKYKDPKKDGAFIDFVKKKEKEIVRAEGDVERALASIAVAEEKLRKAKARKTKAEKSLQAARARRG